MKNLNNIEMNVINFAWAIGFAYGKDDTALTGFKV
jgi:hypothetical protein